MQDSVIKKSEIDHFSDQLQRPLLLPGQSGYNEARMVWNGMIDRRPAMIAQCINVDDVMASVNFAREHHLVISIKGGGHGVAGKAVCDQGLMLDMSLMNKVIVDPQNRTADVGPGATLGDLDQETQKYGLATTGGIVSTTGVAGLTLGGGIGYLARKHGLTLDNLQEADVVTATGKLLHCGKNENPDLFWGLRGGGGNFGVVTRFVLQLHELKRQVMTAQVFYPISDADQVMREYRKLMDHAPDELAGYTLFVNVPPVDPFPPQFQGKPAMLFLACYCGDLEEGRRLLEPFSKIGHPILAALDPMPYQALQQNFNAGVPHGQRYYWKTHFFRDISDEAIKTLIHYGSQLKGPLSLVGFEPMGGAISRIPAEETAFIGRDAKFALGIWLGWMDPGEDDEIIAWAREFHQAMEPFASGGMYSNYLDQDDAGQVQAAYGKHYERLQKLKARFDPHNFFSQNHNIRPEK